MRSKDKNIYISRTYIVESLAHDMEEARRKKVAERISAVPKRVKELDVFSLVGIPLAVVLLAVLILGALQYNTDWKENARMKAQVEQLTQRNSMLETTYRNVYDMDAVQATADKKGMVPASEIEVIFRKIEVPAPKKARTAWDDFVWFMSGLLERKGQE